MAGSHSRLAPSSAARWMKCGQSVVPVVGAGIEEDSEASREGTAAHKLGEICLGSDEDAWQLIGERVEGVEVTQEMATRVQVRLDYIRSFPGHKQTEVKVEARAFHPDAAGTIDDLIYYDDWARIIDYKDGFILHEPNSPQLMSYAWYVAFNEPSINNFKLTIIQPKNLVTPIASFAISRADLEFWAYTELLPAMEKAGTGEYVMGDHCKYCPRLKALQCPAHNQAAEEMVIITQEIESVEGVAALNNAELAELKAGMDPIIRFMKAVDDELSRRLLTLGQEVPGWKVVEKRSDRVWKDYVATVDWPTEFYSKPELLSPARIEKLPGGAVMVAEHAYKPKTGLTIAPSSDKRQAVSIGSVYENVV